jgi:glutaredoxin
MTCDGCNRTAKYLVEGQPHCQEHMLEALCSVPVAVIDIEAHEHAQRKEVVKSGQSETYPTAS